VYRAANKLDVDDIYDASRMAFMEMAVSGVAVGEFHYIHHSPNGQPYGDPNLLSRKLREPLMMSVCESHCCE
jgi:formimidoylglutamate deiminase